MGFVRKQIHLLINVEGVEGVEGVEKLRELKS